MTKKRILVGIFVSLTIFGLTYVPFIIGKNHSASRNTPGDSLQKESRKYDLLAKRIFIDDPNDPQINFSTLKQQIGAYYDKHGLTGSIYFEYLPTGASIRVNGDNREVAASLLKVPAAMDLFKAVELGNVNLDQKVTVTKDMLDSSFGELYKKGAGYTLSVREAAQIMLEQSDNTALAVIAASVKGKIPEDRTVYQYTDVDFSQNKDLTVLMSARAYSSILKCLYFSCYNNKEDSQQILQYLTKSNFNNRLAAGVADKNIKIAYKIGNYSNDVQSDCGIIYYPKRNYLLCVMLNGPDSASTDTDISMLSKITYDYVNALGK